MLRAALLQQPFAAAERGRRQMIAAAGQRILIVIAAADADQLIDFVVVRRDVLVADRPRDLPAVALRAREIEIGVAQRNAAPDIRLAAAAPHARQVERLVPAESEYGLSSGST